ncbi:MAG TPA: tetratricopeptide repeat protein [Kofleriaceae bacterium]|nr:tetratricopeptide repeat protein [Kofleriaceae bacterium]
MSRSPMMGKLAVAAACAAGLVIASPVMAQDKTPAVALFEEGRALAEAGKHAEACKKFEESNRLDEQAVGTLLNLGLCNEKQQKWSTALVWYRASLERAQRSKEQIQMDAANGKIAELTDLVPIIHVEFTTTAPDGTMVMVDGATVDRVKWPQIEVDNGTHTVEVQASGKEPFKEQVEMTSKSKHTTTVVLQAKAAGPTPTNWKRNAFIFGGAGTALTLAGIGSSFIFCGNGLSFTCNKPESEYENKMIGSTVMTVAGVGLIGVGVYYYFFAPKTQTTSTAMFPTVSNDSVGLAITGGF